MLKKSWLCFQIISLLTLYLHRKHLVPFFCHHSSIPKTFVTPVDCPNQASHKFWSILTTRLTCVKIFFSRQSNFFSVYLFQTLFHIDNVRVWDASVMIFTFTLLLVGVSSIHVKMWRNDLRCGANAKLPSGARAQCNPESNPCCSSNGRCGATADHCLCDTCIDFRKGRKTIYSVNELFNMLHIEIY